MYVAIQVVISAALIGAALIRNPTASWILVGLALAGGVIVAVGRHR